MFAHLVASLHTLGFNLELRLRRDEAGATAVEYALMVGLIAVVIIVGVTAFAGDLNSFFNNLSGDLGI